MKITPGREIFPSENIQYSNPYEDGKKKRRPNHSILLVTAVTEGTFYLNQLAPLHFPPNVPPTVRCMHIGKYLPLKFASRKEYELRVAN